MTRSWSVRGERESENTLQAGEAVRTRARGVRPSGLFQNKQEGNEARPTEGSGKMRRCFCHRPQRTVWFQTPGLRVICYVTLAKVLNFSVPNEANSAYPILLS